MVGRTTFRIDAHDWLGHKSIQSMPLEARAVLVQLLCSQWLRESIPASLDEMAVEALLPERALLGAWPHVKAYFTPVEGRPDRLSSKKLERQRKYKPPKLISQEQGLVGDFARAWQRRYPGIEPPFGRVVVKLNMLAKLHDHELLLSAWNLFLDDQDPFYAGHSLNIFVAGNVLAKFFAKARAIAPKPAAQDPNAVCRNLDCGHRRFRHADKCLDCTDCSSFVEIQ